MRLGIVCELCPAIAIADFAIAIAIADAVDKPYQPVEQQISQ